MNIKRCFNKARLNCLVLYHKAYMMLTQTSPVQYLFIETQSKALLGYDIEQTANTYNLIACNKAILAQNKSSLSLKIIL